MPFENVVGKGVNVGNQDFLLFQQCFLPSHNPFLPTFISSAANALNLDESFGKEFTLSQQALVYFTSLLKTLWEKENLLVTRNFFFSNSVFYSFKDFFATFITLKKCGLQNLSFWNSQKFVIGKILHSLILLSS